MENTILEAIQLTYAQEQRLKTLELDPNARVIGHLFSDVVIIHSGEKRNGDYQHLARLSKGGRLCGLGNEQMRKFNRKRRWPILPIS